MQLPRVYFDSQWQRHARVFTPICCRLTYDTIEVGLMGLFVGLVWPHTGPKSIEQFCDEENCDLFLDPEEEQRLRERIHSLRRAKT